MEVVKLKTLNISIRYLFNSGFTVQTKNNFLVFDYYKGTVNFGSGNPYVFSSHGHPDHYNKEVFKWQNSERAIKYIFSSDIEYKSGNEEVTFISPDEELNVDDIKIKAYGSTDLGVSFLIYVDGITIFHAGDLNWWYWPDDTAEEIEIMEKMFKREVAKLKGQHIDIAFFPVDPRLEHNYSLGGEYFIKEISPRFIIPMHFGDKYEATKSFIEKMKNSGTVVLEISQTGQEINL